MVFSSPLFLFLFLPVVLTVYFLLPGLRARNGWLLAVSLLFYAWGEVGFILLLLISTLVNFELGKWVERTEDIVRRKRAVAVAICNSGRYFLRHTSSFQTSPLHIFVARSRAEETRSCG